MRFPVALGWLNGNSEPVSENSQTWLRLYSLRRVTTPRLILESLARPSQVNEPPGFGFLCP